METKHGPLTPSSSTNKRKSRWGDRLTQTISNKGSCERGIARSVPHEDELSLKRYKQFRRGRSSSTSRYNRPTFIRNPNADWRCIVCYLWNSRGQKGCSRCGAFEGVDEVARSTRFSEPAGTPRHSQPEHFKWPSLFETNGSDYVLDPRSNMFYDHSTDFFYDCKSNLYYSNKRKSYFRRIELPHGHSFEQVFGLPISESSTKSLIAESSKPLHQKIEIHIRSKKLGGESRPALLQEPLDKRRKEQLEYVEKWSKLSLKSAIFPPSDASVGSARSLGSIQSRTTRTHEFLDVAENPSQAILNTIHAHQSQPTGPTEKKLPAIITTTAGLPICIVCNRKFASLEHLNKHEQYSELHKTNLSVRKHKDLDGSSTQPSRPKYEDRAKKRRMLHGDLPVSSPTKRMESSVPISRSAVIDPEAALNQHNVGHQLFQKMIAKSSSILPELTGLSQNIKEDWRRIENMNNPQASRQNSEDKRKGLGF